jgi:hypothetical protein
LAKFEVKILSNHLGLARFNTQAGLNQTTLASPITSGLM